MSRDGKRRRPADLETCLREAESRAAQLERQVLDLGIMEEQVRLQNERLEEAQHVLERSRGRYVDLYDFAPIPYLTLDRFGVVLGLNLAAAKLLATNRQRLLGYPFSHLVARASQQRFLDLMRRCRAREEAVTTELELAPRYDAGVGDEPVPVEVYSRCFKTEEGLEVLTVLTDLRERRRAEEERRRLERERAAREAREHFLAVLSHELRTPLTPILASVGLLERKVGLAPEVRETLELVRRNVTLEARLIDDLLDLTRIEQRKLRLDRRVVDLHELVFKVAADARAQASAADVELELDVGARRHHVDADPDRLRQVLWNLLGNAFKFTPAGGRVTVATADEPDGVAVTVRDTGRGIAPDRLGELFRPFHQVTAALPGRGSGGLGLGLAISRGLAEAHGGTLAAASDGEGRGATFTLRLPTVAPPRAPSSPAVPAPRPRHELHVLLVEDHRDTADALAEVFAFEGWDVTVARSVREALERARPEHELLVSDLALPDGSGHELLAELHRRGLRPVAVALSGFGAGADVARSRDTGFQDHLTKPVDLDVLIDRLQRLHAESHAEG